MPKHYQDSVPAAINKLGYRALMTAIKKRGAVRDPITDMDVLQMAATGRVKGGDEELWVPLVHLAAEGSQCIHGGLVDLDL